MDWYEDDEYDETKGRGQQRGGTYHENRKRKEMVCMSSVCKEFQSLWFLKI